MRTSSKIFAAVAALACMTAGFSGPVAAQNYPTKPVTIVVPFPAGGGVDALARVVAAKLTDAFKQQVVVENRGGAGGTLGTAIAARAAADGYTLVLGHTGTMAINPSLYVKLNIDPDKQFTPIGMVGQLPVALVAHPSFPAKTVPEFIKLAKEQGSKLTVGTSGVGTGGNLAAEMFKAAIGAQFTIVPYKGTGPLMNDLMGNHVPVVFGVLAPVIGNLNAGKLNAIAVTSNKRFSLLPNVPTADESGMKGFEAVLTYGLLAPKGTPKAIVDKLSTELRKLVVLEDVKKQIQRAGGDALSSTPEEYAAVLDKEAKAWGGVIKKLNLKVE